MSKLFIVHISQVYDQVSEATRSSLRDCKFQNSSGGACPQTPLVWKCPAWPDHYLCSSDATVWVGSNFRLLFTAFCIQILPGSTFILVEGRSDGDLYPEGDKMYY